MTALALALVLAQAAPATGPGRLLPPPAWPMPSSIERRTVAIAPIAQCLWAKARGDADRFLTTPLLSPAEHERGRVLLANHQSCFGNTLSFATPVPVLRGALAQARLRTVPGALDGFARRAPATTERAPSTDGRSFLVAYATCLANARPGWAAAFLRSPDGTEAERRQFLQFDDSLKSCMPEDRAYRVDMAGLRDEMAAVVDLMVTRGTGGS